MYKLVMCVKSFVKCSFTTQRNTYNVPKLQCSDLVQTETFALWILEKIMLIMFSSENSYAQMRQVIAKIRQSRHMTDKCGRKCNADNIVYSSQSIKLKAFLFDFIDSSSIHSTFQHYIFFFISNKEIWIGYFI